MTGDRRPSATWEARMTTTAGRIRQAARAQIEDTPAQLKIGPDSRQNVCVGSGTIDAVAIFVVAFGSYLGARYLALFQSAVGMRIASVTGGSRRPSWFSSCSARPCSRTHGGAGRTSPEKPSPGERPKRRCTSRFDNSGRNEGS
jgi:hypothetical protein